MARATQLPHSAHRRPLAALAALGVMAIIAVGLVAALSFRGSEPTQTPEVRIPIAPALPAGPGGVITYEVTGKGLFTSTGEGAALGRTTVDQLHAEGLVAAAVDEAPSPDGKWTAAILRNPEGVFLALRGEDGVQRIATQLASGDGPALVAGGKGHARAVEGVPLVVAWSPDSKTLAFGSVTGSPYFLGLLSNPGAVNPAITYREVSGGYVGELAWSPDGKNLAISTYSLDRLDHSVLIADPATGYVKTLIDGCHLTWSPDSEYVAVHRDPGPEAGAWVIAAANKSDRWAITREVQAFPLTWREG